MFYTLIGYVFTGILAMIGVAFFWYMFTDAAFEKDHRAPISLVLFLLFISLAMFVAHLTGI